MMMPKEDGRFNFPSHEKGPTQPQRQDQAAAYQHGGGSGALGVHTKIVVPLSYRLTPLTAYGPALLLPLTA